jgi:hypothetical protein
MCVCVFVCVCYIYPPQVCVAQIKLFSALTFAKVSTDTELAALYTKMWQSLWIDEITGSWYFKSDIVV